MDYSKLSDAQLLALENNDFSKLKDNELADLQDKIEGKTPSVANDIGDMAGYAWQGLKSAGGGALDALDYVGGVSRTALGSLGNLTGKDIVSKQDFIDAINPLDGKQAPSTSDMLGKSGMEDGFTRGALGFAGDILLDPTTYGTGGLSAINKIAKSNKLDDAIKLANAIGDKMPSMTKGVSKVQDKLGRLINKGALGRLDTNALKGSIRFGGGSILPSDVIYNNGKSGNFAEIAKYMIETVPQNTLERKNILDFASDNIEPVLENALKQSENLIGGLKNKTKNVYSPLAEKALQEQGGTVKKISDKLYGVKDSVILDSKGNPFKKITKSPKLSDLATQKAEIDKVFYGINDPKLGEITSQSKEILGDIRKGLKDEITNSIRKLSPEMAEKYERLGKESSALLNAMGPAEASALIEGRKVSVPVLTAVMAGDTLGGILSSADNMGTKATRLASGLLAKTLNASGSGTKLAQKLRRASMEKGIANSGIGTLDHLPKRLLITTNDD